MSKREAEKPEPRDVTHGERASWFDAAMQQKPPRSLERNRNLIQDLNPVRWARLQRELRWFQKQAPKLGINPDDIRWML